MWACQKRFIMLSGLLLLSILGHTTAARRTSALEDDFAPDRSIMLLQHKASVANHASMPIMEAEDAADSAHPHVQTQHDAALSLNLLELGTQVGASADLDSPRMIESVFPACAFVACVVIAVYWPQGPVVISRILAYIFALSSMKLSVKFVFSNYGFNFPKFLTAGHLMLSSTVGFLIIMSRHHFYEKAFPVPTWNEFVYRIGPIAFAFAFSLAMNNSGLVYCSAAFAEIVGSTTPLVTVVVTLLLGLPFNKWLLIPTLVVMLGCAMSVSGEMNISVLGTMFCFAANVGRGVKSAMQQDLLTGETRAKFDPCALLAWTCFTSALIMIAWSVITEGLAPIVALQTASASAQLLMAIFASCINACMLNLVVLYVTKDLGAVGQLIAGQVASVLTVGGGVILFGDHLSFVQVIGFITVLGGAFTYSRIAKSSHGHSAPAPAKQEEGEPAKGATPDAAEDDVPEAMPAPKA